MRSSLYLFAAGFGSVLLGSGRSFRRTHAAIWITCFLHVGAAQALTIEGSFSTSGGTSEVLTSIETLGIFFFDELGDYAGDDFALLFEGLVLSNSSVGTTVFSNSSVGSEFDRAVDFLTNGIDGYVFIGFGHSSGASAASGQSEAIIFAHDPLGTGGPDLLGMNITRIGFRLDSLVLDSPGSDPNGDGLWTDQQIGATLVFEGVLVPEPSTGSLIAVALCVWSWRQNRKRLSKNG